MKNRALFFILLKTMYKLERVKSLFFKLIYMPYARNFVKYFTCTRTFDFHSCCIITDEEIETQIGWMVTLAQGNISIKEELGLEPR